MLDPRESHPLYTDLILKAPGRRLLAHALLASSLTALLFGCGLSHYQERMEQQQARISRLDEEENSLGPPVQMPDKQGRPTLYFRPPKGINSTASVQEGAFQHFAVARGATSAFLDVAVAAEDQKEEEFWTAILRCFPGKELNNVAKKKPKELPRRGKILFDELIYDDGQSRDVRLLFVRSFSETVRVAVAYRVDKASKSDPNVQKQIDASLGSMAVSTEASGLLRSYSERARKKSTKEGGAKR